MSADDQEMKDLRARAAANDHLRTGGYAPLRAALKDDPDLPPDREVPCARCGTPTLFGGLGWWVGKIFGRQLAATGKKPLENHELTWCKPCRVKVEADQLARSLELERKLGQAIQQAKDDPALYMNPMMTQVCADMRRMGESETAAAIERIYLQRREKASEEAKAGPGRRGRGRGYSRGGLDESVS